MKFLFEVRMSASWFLVSMYLIWIFGSKLIRSNNQSSATLWILETCLSVGLLPLCGGVEDVISVLTLVCRGVAQVFHVLLVELRLLLVAEVEEGEEEDGQEESWEVESGVGRVKEKQPLTCMAWRWM